MTQTARGAEICEHGRQVAHCAVCAPARDAAYLASRTRVLSTEMQRAVDILAAIMRTHRAGVLCCEEPARDGCVTWIAQCGVGSVAHGDWWQGPRRATPGEAIADVIAHTERLSTNTETGAAR